MQAEEWSIQQVARLAGTTSRTLRHYADVGLLAPSRIGANGYRHYDRAALERLQRILLLRDLGLSLPQIGAVLDRDVTPQAALARHLDWLREEQDRLTRQIASVKATIDGWEGGEKPMAENMFDGFDHTRYRNEVRERWGEQTWADGDRWWRGMSGAERTAFQQGVSDLSRDWAAAAAAGVPADGPEATALAERHVRWLTGVPGTPTATAAETKAYVIGLGEMYVADDRFGADYGGPAGAEFVRDALRAYADAHL